jgi:hypothetical protein
MNHLYLYLYLHHKYLLTVLQSNLLGPENMKTKKQSSYYQNVQLSVFEYYSLYRFIMTDWRGSQFNCITTFI